MRFLHFILAFLICAAGVGIARADFDVYPYSLGGKLVTGGHDDVLGANNITERVFGYNFGEDPLDPFVIGDPGFNNGTEGIGVFPGNGLLPTFSTLGFNVLTNLQYWNGAGSVSFSSAPTGVDLGITRGSTTVHINGLGLSGSVPTIGSTGAAGRLHVHVQSTLNSATTPADGIYMFGLQMTLPGSGLANSDPIYFVYNNNLSDPIHDEAIDWVQANLVPEPATWAMMATALIGLLVAGWRKHPRFGTRVQRTALRT